jgi:hypothetical protein
MINLQAYISPLLRQKQKSGKRNSPVAAFLPLIGLLLLSSCGTSPPRSPIATSPAPVTSPPGAPSPASPVPSPTASPRSRTQPLQASPTATKTVAVNVYKLDNQCKNFVAEKVTVPANQPITGAVGKVLEDLDSADFSLSGYRVNVASGVATIDLRVAPDSRRKLVSLSSCEQLALFGSLRRTLTSNPQWKIRSVRFTDRGQEVVL